MIRRVIFAPEAELEVAEAYQWYEERDLGLGAEFLRALDSCVHEIERHPEDVPYRPRECAAGRNTTFPLLSLLSYLEGNSLRRGSLPRLKKSKSLERSGLKG